MKLLAKLKALSTLNFSFSDVTVTKDKDGGLIAILTLTEPIPHVRGSQEVELDNKRVPAEAFDVSEIKIHQAAMEAADEDFEFSEDGKEGTYEGDKLILDVAKNSGGVWLTQNSFASQGQKMRNEFRQTQVGKIFGKKNASAPVKQEVTA